MGNKKDDMVIVKRFQSNFHALQKLSGLSVSELSHYSNLTRQTIYNMMDGKSKMFKFQYISFRKLFDHMIKTGNVYLSYFLILLVDNTYSDEIYNKLVELAKAISVLVDNGSTITDSIYNMGINNIFGNVPELKYEFDWIKNII